MLIDRFDRQVTYLRISVTDRCNLRCVYCLPPDGVAPKSHEEILTYEEIAELVRVAAGLGVREVRLTGGEPLVRKKLADLVRMIAGISGIEDISLTSNGLLLEQQADQLAQAGLKRVNLSIDSLDPVRFHHITRGGSLDRFWAGVRAAEEAGLNPIKLNVVVMRGVNDDELVDMARLSLNHPWHVRFIEIMPILNQNPWGEGFPAPDQTYFPIHEILALLNPLGLQPVETAVGSGPAVEYRLTGGIGRIGFISPLGEKFCERCNRLRLTADGNLRPCLLREDEISIREALRTGQPLDALLEQAVLLKPDGHELESEVYPTGRCMRQIGG